MRVCGLTSGVEQGAATLLIAAALLCPAVSTARIVPIFISVHHHQKNGAIRHEIEDLEDTWHKALLANAVPILSSLLADSYIAIGPDGTLSSKADELAARTSGQQIVQKIEVQDQRVRVYGNTAVVTSKVNIEATYAGQPMVGQYRYTRVWSLQHGQWRIVSFEANRIHDTSSRSH